MLGNVLSVSLLFLNILDTLKLLKQPKRRQRPPLHNVGDGSNTAYTTRRRVTTLQREQMRGMLMLWVTWAVMRQCVGIADDLVGWWLPFYGYVRSAFIGYLCLTRSFGGGIIYRRLIKPNLDRYSQRIDLATELILLVARWIFQLVLLVTVVPSIAARDAISTRIRRRNTTPTPVISSSDPSTPERPPAAPATRQRRLTADLVQLGLSTPRSVHQALTEARAIFQDVDAGRKEVEAKANELRVMRAKFKPVGGDRIAGRTDRQETVRQTEERDMEEELRLDAAVRKPNQAKTMGRPPTLPVNMLSAGTSRSRPSSLSASFKPVTSHRSIPPVDVMPSIISDVPSIYPSVSEPQDVSPVISSTAVPSRRSQPTNLIPPIRRELQQSRTASIGPMSPMVPGGFRFGQAHTTATDRMSVRGLVDGGPSLQPQANASVSLPVIDRLTGTTSTVYDLEGVATNNPISTTSVRKRKQSPVCEAKDGSAPAPAAKRQKTSLEQSQSHVGTTRSLSIDETRRRQKSAVGGSRGRAGAVEGAADRGENKRVRHVVSKVPAKTVEVDSTDRLRTMRAVGPKATADIHTATTSGSQQDSVSSTLQHAPRATTTLLLSTAGTSTTGAASRKRKAGISAAAVTSTQRRVAVPARRPVDEHPRTKPARTSAAVSVSAPEVPMTPRRSKRLANVRKGN